MSASNLIFCTDSLLQVSQVAAAMLPLFEDQPSWLGAIHWLNASSPPQPLAFEEYLAEWRCQVPPQRTETIDCIAALFGVSLPDHPAS